MDRRYSLQKICEIIRQRVLVGFTAMTIYTEIDSPLGPLLLTSSDGMLTGLFFCDQPHGCIQHDWVRQDDAEIFALTKQQLKECACWEREGFELPLGLKGTPFQVLVWNAIAEIPFGQTITYSELAERIGRSASDARAVGNATGQNPLSWVIPCHRVVGKSGEPTGYAGGLERKSGLLAFEAARARSLSAV
jgi:methylated-DNA-[protein]-cysteine S-methyltransferase